jgi:hypothetical protein
VNKPVRRRINSARIDRGFEIARQAGDPRILDALVELSRVAVENREAAATAVEAPKKKRETAREAFHKLHTATLAPANMLAQMTMASLLLHPGELMLDPSFEEGVKFFVYTAFGYLLPSIALVVFHSEKIGRKCL